MDLQSTMSNETTTRLEVFGDTLIGGQAFSKLVASWEVGYYQIGNCEFTSSGIGGVNINRYEGAIRTDENYQVKFIPDGATEVITLYDFSLSVGDSVLLSEENNPYYAHLLEIDTIPIGKSYRRRFTMRGMYGNEDVWIEGIGSLYGLLTPEFRFLEFNSYELSCYEENNITLYSSRPVCTRCDIVTRVRSEKSPTELTIYPNPIVDESIIRLPRRSTSVIVKVYDLFGREKYNRSCIDPDNITLKKQDIGYGLYIIEIIDNNGNRYRDEIIIL